MSKLLVKFLSLPLILGSLLLVNPSANADEPIRVLPRYSTEVADTNYGYGSGYSNPQNYDDRSYRGCPYGCPYCPYANRGYVDNRGSRDGARGDNWDNRGWRDRQDNRGWGSWNWGDRDADDRYTEDRQRRDRQDNRGWGFWNWGDRDADDRDADDRVMEDRQRRDRDDDDQRMYRGDTQRGMGMRQGDRY